MFEPVRGITNVSTYAAHRGITRVSTRAAGQCLALGARYLLERLRLALETRVDVDEVERLAVARAQSGPEMASQPTPDGLAGAEANRLR